MENSPITGHQFIPGSARSDGVVDHVAVRMQRALNEVSSWQSLGVAVAAGFLLGRLAR